MKKLKLCLLFTLLLTTMVLLLALSTSAATYNGEFGTNVTWSLDTNTGVLVISGEGEMPDFYASHVSAQWRNYLSHIKSVVIKNGITRIGDFAFYNCFNMTSIEIPYGVKSIGEGAFYGCNELTEITLPNSVTSISTYAFQGSQKLTYVNLGNGIIDIGNTAFADCPSLKEITLPDTLSSMGTDVFRGCTSLTSVNLGTGLTTIPYNTFWDCAALTEITLPNQITSIEVSAFYGCSSLTKIDIPNSVTTIGLSAFSNCTQLKTVTIPEGITEIEQTFWGCTELESITLPNSLKTIGGFTFSYCTSLTDITIPSGVTSIGTNAFEGCTGFTSITLPTGIISIADGAFSLCTELTSVTVPSSVTSIGAWTFYDCSKLKTINYIGTQAQWKKVKTGEEWLVGTDNCIVIFNGDHTCKWDDGSVIVAPTPTSNGTKLYTCECGKTKAEAFAGEMWGKLYWWYDGSTQTLTIWGEGKIDDFSSLNSIDGWRKYIYIKNVVITEGITSIGNYVFAEKGVMNVTLPYNVKHIGDYAFYRCGLASVSLTNGVTSIGSYAFSGSSLASVTIPSSVTTTGKCAFSECKYLQSITVCGNIANIGDDMFAGCNLNDLTICDGVKHIGNGMFSDCYYLSRVALPDSIQSIGDSAFSLCETLSEINFPKNLTSIGNQAFYKTALTAITIPGHITTLSYGVFQQCESLTSVVIEEGITSISEAMFNNCWALKAITIPNSVTSIGKNGFSYCSSLETVTYIGTQAQWAALTKGDMWDWQICENYKVKYSPAHSHEWDGGKLTSGPMEFAVIYTCVNCGTTMTARAAYMLTTGTTITYYDSLDGAFTAVQNGSVITLLTNLAEAAPVLNMPYSYTINGNGFSLTLTPAQNAALTVSAGNVTLQSITLQMEMGTSAAALIAVQDSAKLTIQSGVFVISTQQTISVSGMDSALEIDGGIFVLPEGASTLVNNKNAAVVAIQNILVLVTGANELMFDSNTVIETGSYAPQIKFAGKRYSFYMSRVSSTTTDVATKESNGAALYLCADKARSGIRFTTSLSESAIALVKEALAAGKTVSYGTLIAPADYVAAAGAFTKEALDKLNVATAYEDVCAINSLRDSNGDGVYEQFSATLINLKEKNYARVFAAVAYVVIDGETYYSGYNSVDNARSAKQIAEALLANAEYTAGITEIELGILRGYTNAS